MQGRYGEITCPLLLLNSPQDHVVEPDNGDHLAATYGGPVERILLELARKGMDRQAAYVVVQRNAMRMYEEAVDFKTARVTEEITLGKDVEIHIYDDAGHGFENPNNKQGYVQKDADEAYELQTKFFAEKLKK